MKKIEVVGAVIVDSGEVLCAQRSQEGNLPGKWEFPGGKIEKGESPREALSREILEELGVEVEIGNVITSTEYEYDFAVVSLTTFYCSLVSTKPIALEHNQIKWLQPDLLGELDWAPADIPAVTIIQADLAS